MNPLRFHSDLRYLNKELKCKPYSIPKIIKNLFKLERFQYATSIHLNMGYNNIQMTENASNLGTIILPWGKYHFKRLLMQVSNSPDIFQHKLNDLFQVSEFLSEYIAGLLMSTKGYWTYCAHQLKLILNELK